MSDLIDPAVGRRNQPADPVASAPPDQMADLAHLVTVARETRILSVKELHEAQSGHPGSSLSAMDMYVAVYCSGLFRHRPQDPGWQDRDYFILSAGHAVPGLYACLARAGYGPLEELNTLRKIGSRLPGHATRGSYPGIEASSGSLGQGLGVGLGLCLGLRLSGRPNRVVVLMSDGEQQEGSTWESIMFAGSHQPGGLVAVVDKNTNQISGPTHSIMPILDELPSKYRAFGWETLDINGNEMVEAVEALAVALASDHPVAIISHTTTGKGVSFMENDYHWHHGVITDDLFLRAMTDLGALVSSTSDDTWLPEHTSLIPGAI
jgi:transketolase